MLDEFVRPIPRNPLLSDEERRRMTEANRRAAQGEHAEEAPEPAHQPRSPKHRRPLRDSEREEHRRAAAEHEAGEERKRASDRRRMSEHNRREAGRRLTAQPQPPREKRHVVPTDEELIAQLRETQAAEHEREEAARLHRMQQSAANLRSSWGRSSADYTRQMPVMLHSAVPVTAGSSAVAIGLSDAPEQSEQQSELTQPELLPQEEEEPETAAVEGGRYSMGRRTGGYPKRMTTLRIVLVGAVTVALIGMVIYGKVQANELYTEVRRLQAQYDDIVAQNVSMRSEMEGKMTVKNIEEYAENVLGLKQLDQSQIQYIQIQTEDEVTITEPETNWLVTVNDFLSDIWNFFQGA